MPWSLGFAVSRYGRVMWGVRTMEYWLSKSESACKDARTRISGSKYTSFLMSWSSKSFLSKAGFTAVLASRMVYLIACLRDWQQGAGGPLEDKKVLFPAGNILLRDP